MLTLVLSALLYGAPVPATPGGTDRWIDTQMASLREVFAETGRRLTVEQDAMARVILEAASAYGNTPDQGTFALWITTRPLRGNSFLIESIAKVLWPHKAHVHHQLFEYTRDAAQPRRFNRLGAILIIDDVSEKIMGMLEAYRLRNRIAGVVDDEHDYGAVIVVDSHDLLSKHGARLPARFRVLDLARVIDDCQKALVTATPDVALARAG